MPKYGWYDPETDKEFETDMKYEDMLQFKKDNPELEQRFNLNFVSSQYTTTGGKMDDGWKEMLGRIADENPGSDMAEHGTRRTAKQVKTADAIAKNRKRLGTTKRAEGTTGERLD
jgi:hypothetical protein